MNLSLPEPTALQAKLDAYQRAVNALVMQAYRDGVVIDVAIVPNQPFAMGWYTPVVSARPRRELAPSQLSLAVKASFASGSVAGYAALREERDERARKLWKET